MHKLKGLFCGSVVLLLCTLHSTSTPLITVCPCLTSPPLLPPHTQVVSSLRAYKEASAVEMPRLYGAGPKYEPVLNLWGQLIGASGTWLDLDRCVKGGGQASWGSAHCIYCMAGKLSEW